MESKKIIESYFQWLVSQVCTRKERKEYNDVLRVLHATTFRFSIERDMNRAADGIDMRSRFADEKGISCEERRNAITGPCTVLEMLVGLADRAVFSMIEGEITGEDDEMHWIFWVMMSNLGLVGLKNESYSYSKAMKHIDIFLDRKYAYNGEKGALFKVSEPRNDLREVEIWFQMCWFISEITDLE